MSNFSSQLTVKSLHSQVSGLPVSSVDTGPFCSRERAESRQFLLGFRFPAQLLPLGPGCRCPHGSWLQVQGSNPLHKMALTLVCSELICLHFVIFYFHLQLLLVLLSLCLLPETSNSLLPWVWDLLEFSVKDKAFLADPRTKP